MDKRRTLIPLLTVEDFYNDLQTMIVDSVSTCLKHHKKNQEDTPSITDEILNVRQAAELLKLAIPTIYAQTSNRSIPHFKRGKKLYFKKDDLIKWIESGKRKTASEIKLEASKL